ncbi:MAG: lysozyme inhibitor LprI family protein [Sarcina sp.]
MKKKLILKILAGVLVVVVAVGAGIVIGRVSKKEQPPATNVSKQKDAGDTKASNNVAENKDNNGEKDTTMPSKNEEVTKAPVSNNEKPKVEENITTKNENKDNGTAKEEVTNSIYKPGVSDERLKEVKDKYYEDMGNTRTYFGRHFESTGELLFSNEKSENEGHINKFYDMMDKNLNDLWGDLKTILSDSEMKKLTQEQVKWIKQKDSIEKDATDGCTAETNTKYARGKETYKRCLYLENKYLNY